MKTTLFIPTKNEIEGVKTIIPRIKKEWVDEIIIIDDSTDGTREYLEQQGFTVLQQEKPGILAAWWQGFEAATGDIIIPFSPDNNSVPEVIPKLVDKIKEGYDMVIASRYAKGVKSEDDTLLSGLANFILTKIINILFGGHYTDALGMYRAFRKELLHSLNLDQHKEDIFELLLSIRAAKYKLKIAEIPGDEPARLGKNKDSRAWPGLA
jgi:glycosyltransferase involved in cell wall biosynthesis